MNKDLLMYTITLVSPWLVWYFSGVLSKDEYYKYGSETHKYTALIPIIFNAISIVVALFFHGR